MKEKFQKIIVSIFFVYIALNTNAQHLVSGRVLSALDRQPLQGVNVRLNDTLHAITDRAGQFSFIRWTSATEMQLSLIGYVPLITPVPAVDATYYMEPANQLIEEVKINTGYQRLPKERVTGAFEHVDSALFHRQISTDVISRLDGIASGLLFDKRNGQLNPHTMSVRGLSTLTSSMSIPLIIVDNFPYEGDINNINPNDVENVTILKDAAAASIWGARAGNGVLVITTKKAHFERRPVLRVVANTSVQERPDLFYDPKMSPSDFIDVERFLFDQGAYNFRLNNRTNYPVLSPVVEILHRLDEGDISASEANRLIDNWRNYDVRDDLYRHFYRMSVRQQYNASLLGGGRRINYRVSVGHDRNRHNEVGNGLSRTTVRINNQFRPLERLLVETMTTFNNTQTTGNHPGTIWLGNSIPLYPYIKLADENGRALSLSKNYRQGFIDTAGNGQLLDWSYRPLDELTEADNNITLNNATFQLSAHYQIVSSFNAEIRYHYQYQQTAQQNLQSEDLWETRNTINRFTELIDGQPVYAVPRGGIMDQGQQTLQAHGLRGQLNFDRNWREQHELTAIGGGELRDNARSGRTSRVWGYDPNTLTHIPVDLVTRHSIYGTLGGVANIADPTSFSGTKDRFVSFYANAAYAFDRRYHLSASLRRDASNLFGVSTNNRWKPLWSIGAAYSISNEPWYMFGILPSLKLRATYGYSGNVNNGTPAMATIQYARFPSQLGRFPYATVNNPPNPELRWEQVATLNVGLDFNVRNRRLGGSIDYYRKHASDLMALVPWDQTAGVSSVMTNSANMQTNGWDATIYFLPLDGEFRWETNLLFSYNKHLVTRHFQELRPYMLPGNGLNLFPIAGRSAYEVVSYRWAGLDSETGDPMGYLNGQASKDYQQLNWGSVALDDLVFHGSALPKYYGALRNRFEWKRISFSANLTYRLGYFFRKNTIHYASLLGGNENGHADFYDRWLQPGDELHTQVPSLVYPVNSQRDNFYRDAAINVLRGDHIRLQDAMLSYRWDQPPLQRKMGIKHITLSLQANNLGVFIWRANKLGLDPDFLDRPMPRSVALGLNLHF